MNDTVKTLKSNSTLPTAAEVESYTEEQMEQLAIHFGYRLKTGDEAAGKEFLAWRQSLSPDKWAQFGKWVFESVSDCKVEPSWRVKRDFLVNETDKA